MGFHGPHGSHPIKKSPELRLAGLWPRQPAAFAGASAAGRTTGEEARTATDLLEPTRQPFGPWEIEVLTINKRDFLWVLNGNSWGLMGIYGNSWEYDGKQTYLENHPAIVP